MAGGTIEEMANDKGGDRDEDRDEDQMLRMHAPAVGAVDVYPPFAAGLLLRAVRTSELVSQMKEGPERTYSDFFLAMTRLPW